MSKIVGLVGLAGSGKNSVANILIKNYPNWVALSSGSAVKGDMDAYKKYRDEEEKLWNEYKKTIINK